MENGLVMDVSGSWVRRVKTAAQLNQFSDAAEELFLAQHYGNAKPIRVVSHNWEENQERPKFNSN